MATRTKTISGDFLSGAYVVADKLFDVMPISCAFIDTSGDVVMFHFDAELSAEDEATFDAFVAAYDGLDALKHRRKEDINVRTRELATSGYTHNGRVFSTSETAQRNMGEVSSNKDTLSYPFNMATRGDGEIYAIADAAEVATMYGTGLGSVTAHYQSGNTLKASIIAATTKAEVDAVVDSR